MSGAGASKAEAGGGHSIVLHPAVIGCSDVQEPIAECPF